MKRLFLPLMLLSFAITKSQAQVTYPENGVANPQSPTYAFVNATVVKDAANILVEAGARKDTKNNHDVSPKDISPELFK